MDARTVIGRFVRNLRERKRLTLEQLAGRTAITYQYISGVENGRENFSIEVLERLGKSLGCPLPQLVAGAYAPAADAAGVMAKKECFRPEVPLPPGMKLSHQEAAMNAAHSSVACINANL